MRHMLGAFDIFWFAARDYEEADRLWSTWAVGWMKAITWLIVLGLSLALPIGGVLVWVRAIES